MHAYCIKTDGISALFLAMTHAGALLLMNVERQQAATYPQTKPTDLRCESSCIGCHSLHPVTQHCHLLLLLSPKAYTHCCTMLCKRSLCHHAVSVRVSVTFVHSVKTNKDIFKNFFTIG